VYAVIVSAPLEGEVAQSAKGGSTNNMQKNWIASFRSQWRKTLSAF